MVDRGRQFLRLGLIWNVSPTLEPIKLDLG